MHSRRNGTSKRCGRCSPRTILARPDLTKSGPGSHDASGTISGASNMTNQSEYTPPRIWTWSEESGGAWASINRPVSGATHDKELPVGRHPLHLYSLGTPNGVKVTVMLEELLALGHAGAEYDAWPIRINNGDQFGSGFVAVNPNSKIPALMDHSSARPVRVFESGSILLHL